MSYLSFLQWVVSLASQAPAIFQHLEAIADQVQAIIELLGLPKTLAVTDDATPSAEVVEQEAAALALLGPETSGDVNTLAVRDGSKLRKLFEILGPMLPTLIALFGKK